MNETQTAADKSTYSLRPATDSSLRVTTLEQQDQNDLALADWVIDRILLPQSAFDDDAIVVWTESGKERIRKLILGAFKSARRNTAPIKTSERIPTRGDADLNGELVAYLEKPRGWICIHFEQIVLFPAVYPYWMPIPPLPVERADTEVETKLAGRAAGVSTKTSAGE